MQSFVDKMDKLELPNQLVAVLADPLLQKLLLLRPSAESYMRVANWLNAALQEVVDGDADETTLWEMMDVVRDFVVQIKVRRKLEPVGQSSCCLLTHAVELACYRAQLFCPLLSTLEWRGFQDVHLPDSSLHAPP